MLYPIYVHVGDGHHAHGITIPDMPGCFSAADCWDDIPAKVQEAVELYFEGESLAIPTPTPIEQLMAQSEIYHDGVWMAIDIDISKLKPKSIRLNISLPEPLVNQIDAYALSHHMSRSGFLAMAVSKVLSGY